jgi:hypothetical protein
MEDFLAERLIGEAKSLHGSPQTAGYAIYMGGETWPTLWATREEVDRMAVDYTPPDGGDPYRVVWVNERREIVPPPEE